MPYTRRTAKRNKAVFINVTPEDWEAHQELVQYVVIAKWYPVMVREELKKQRKRLGLTELETSHEEGL